MYKTIRKGVSFVLASVLFLGMLSGCGASSDYVTDKYLDYITNLVPEEMFGVFRFVRK